MSGPAETIEFMEDDLGPVVAAMDVLLAAADGGGWVNIGPSLTDEEAARVPPRSGLAAWFSGRGPSLPMGTWMPPVTKGKPRVAQIGLEHGTGPNALLRLAERFAGDVLSATAPVRDKFGPEAKPAPAKKATTKKAA